MGDDVGGGGDPMGDMLGNALADGGVGGGVILRPKKAGERRGDHRAGHVEEDEDFGAAKGGEGASGEFDEENDCDPACCAGKVGTGEEGQIHGGGHHYEADEDAADDGAHGEAIREQFRRLEQEAIFLEFAVFFHAE